MIPDNVINQVLDLDIVKIFEDENFEPKRAGGGRKVVCCPFHHEKTPSLSIDVTKNLWHCFGCGEGGNGIGFIMKLKGYSFPEAVKYLAQRNGIQYEEKELTPEEKEEQFHRERLYKVNELAQKFFVSQLASPESTAYLKERGWDISEEAVRDVVGHFGIGFAPKANALLNYLRQNGWNDLALLEEAGLISRNEETLDPYDFFRNRLMFPIFNSTGQVVGFSGRDITGTQHSKYVNTRDTPIYNKGRVLFGWTQALRRIATEKKVVLVEGNPDVMRLHEIGVDYAVAPLGTALTEEQVVLIAKRAQSVIIIGDRDAQKDSVSKDLPGDMAVISHGEALTKAGLTVQVMTLPQQISTMKVDADSYFETNRNITEFNSLLANSTSDYIHWIAGRKMSAANSEKEKAAAIHEICKLVSYVKDATVAELYIEKLAKEHKNGTIWKREFREEKNTREREVKAKDGSNDMMSQYGFYISDGGYCSAGQTGSERRWSNFTMTPILHIKDEKNARRIYELKNDKGQQVVVKMNQSELVSFTDFKTRTETAGNFIWEVGPNELTMLKKYLYADTPSADEIKQLGWQKQWGFYCWGNGGFDEMNNFVKADKYGIIEIGGRKFYLPGAGADAVNNTGGYLTQRKFQYAETNDITLRNFCQKLIDVFGDNAKVGLCFLLATLFKDEVVKITRFFPILNLFGPKGTGKSELGHALTSFFIPNNTAPNINSTTKAALGEAVAEYSNALVHLDEYRQDTELDKQEFLKGLWDGTGRSKLNMDDKKSREVTAVDCGVILSGQQMTNADPALFSRVIYLTFNRTEFSEDEKHRFDDLQIIEDRGLMHLTRQLLSQRSRFVGGFRQAWDATLEDFITQSRNGGIEDRTLRNWVTPLAAFRCLESYIDMPFTYPEMLDICVEGCRMQNGTIKTNNEKSVFWNIVANLISSGKCWYGVDYKIRIGGKPKKFNGCSTMYEFDQTKRYLFFNFNRPISLYCRECRDGGRKGLPADTIRHYLEHDNGIYLGTVRAERFKVVDDARGFINANNKKTMTYQAMVFDYDKLEEQYGICLMVNSDPDEYDQYDNENKPPVYNPGYDEGNIFNE